MPKKNAITFEIYKDMSMHYRWRAVHRNGRILADSGEAYVRLGRCRTAAYNFTTYIADAHYEIIVTK